ncbi:MAG TPA: OmpA family protein [Flavobacteriales bacterium]|jgi:outer membrane protein OmpA-like peptidoglycan-associated protein|nr:OmpA family protein [Flavobacteriales bacterium]
MILRNTLSWLGACALPALLWAQEVPDSLNLIENGSFEQVEGKLKRPGSIEMAKGWKSPTEVNADLYSETVANSPISAPKNEEGEQSALSGQNYAGLLWWSYMNKEPRSYLQAKFKKMLKKDQKYCVRYYVTLGDLSKYNADQLGAYVSKIIVKKDDNSSLTYEPQVPALRTKLFDDLNSWQGVCGVYDAKGDEQYLIIGNFAANEKTNTGKTKRPKGETRVQQAHAYYYIDDVAVFPIKSMSECKCEQLDKAASEFIYSRKTTVNKTLPPASQLDNATVYFKRFNRSIDGSMDMMLTERVAAMKADPNIKIRLVGHADAIETERVRMRPDLTDLDKERAEAVKAVFTEAGIAPERITTAGQKSESPADAGDDEVALSKNRRVEIEIEK